MYAARDKSTADVLKSSAVVLGMLSAFAAWLLTLVGAFMPFDTLAYETFMQANARLTPKASSVLLIEWDPAVPRDETSFSQALGIVENLGAEQVLFNFFPDEVAPDFYEEAVRYGNVVFGQHLLIDQADPEEVKLTELPRAARGQPLPRGIVTLPPTSHGISRQQHAAFQVQGESVASLEVEAGRRQLGEALPALGAQYLVNFRGGAGSIPHVSLERVLTGGLVRELVQGRCVLIGRLPLSTEPGIFTPTTSSDQPMSLLEFQGHALDTLLTRRTIQALSPVGMLVLLVLATSTCALGYQWLEIRLAFWMSFALAAFYGILALALLYYAYIWLPVVELVTAQLVCFLLVFRKKAVESYHAVNRLLLGLSTELQERYRKAGFFTSPEHWSLVANFVTQTLDLNRLIFLEKVERQHRVREVKSVNCSFDDIFEGRRDYTRVPYRTAIETQAPVRVDESRRFFKTVSTEEHHYVAPLVFAGRVLGFWVLAVEPAKAASIANFEGLLRDYSEQIAELLYRRQQVLSEQQETSLWKRLLSFTSEGETYQELGKTATLLERRLGRMEKLFAELDTPVIVYDLFGQVKEVSTAMLDFLLQEKLQPYETTAVELVATLTGSDMGVARRCLRHVIIEKGEMALPVRARQHTGNYVLQLRPLAPKKKGEHLDDPSPFNVSGVRCELLDRTLLAQLDQLKERIAERLGVHLRNDLATIEFSASLFSTEDLSVEERREVASTIHAKVTRAVETLADCELYFSVDAQVDVDRLPVDGHVALDSARRNVALLAQSQQVALAVEQPRILNYVLASPDPLHQLFEHILTFLIKDAREKSTLSVCIEETDKWIVFAFQNVGFGMSEERFQAYLFGSEEAASEEFKNLRAGIRRVNMWKGKFEATTKVGQGTSIIVSLQKFG